MFDRKQDRQRTIHWFKSVSDALKVKPQVLIDAYRVKIDKRPDMDLDKITTEEIWSAACFFETGATVGDLEAREIQRRWGNAARAERQEIEREERENRMPSGFHVATGVRRCLLCTYVETPRGSNGPFNCGLCGEMTGARNMCDRFSRKTDVPPDHPMCSCAIHGVKIEMTFRDGPEDPVRPADCCCRCIFSRKTNSQVYYCVRHDKYVSTYDICKLNSPRKADPIS